jgi:hypothetical protein
MNNQGAPNLFTADELRKWDTHTKNSKGCWVCARPLGWQGLRLMYRLKLAWGVFTAKYDAVKWDEE